MPSHSRTCLEQAPEGTIAAWTLARRPLSGASVAQPGAGNNNNNNNNRAQAQVGGVGRTHTREEKLLAVRAARQGVSKQHEGRRR